VDFKLLASSRGELDVASQISLVVVTVRIQAFDTRYARDATQSLIIRFVVMFHCRHMIFKPLIYYYKIVVPVEIPIKMLVEMPVEILIGTPVGMLDEMSVEMLNEMPIEMLDGM